MFELIDKYSLWDVERSLCKTKSSFSCVHHVDLNTMRILQSWVQVSGIIAISYIVLTLKVIHYMTTGEQKGDNKLG